MYLVIALNASLAGALCLGKILLRYSPPILLVGLKLFFGGLVLLLFQYFIRKKLVFNKKDIPIYLAASLFSIFLPQVLRFWALSYNMPLGKITLLRNLSPFFSYIFGFFIGIEKVERKKLLGLIIGFVGLLPIIKQEPSPDIQLQAFYFLSWPELAVIFASAISSYGWIIKYSLIRKKQYPATTISGITLFLSGILALLTSYFFEAKPIIADPTTFITLLALTIFGSNIITHNLYVYLLKYYKPTFLSFTRFMLPIFGALYGWIFFKEPITWHFLISLGAIFIGLWLFYSSEKKETTIKPLET